MQYEDAVAYCHGKMPRDCYTIPSTVEELIEAIETLGFGSSVIDADNGECLTFGRTVGGKWVLATAEFLDDDERIPNPDFHICRFDTVREGVQRFTINGKRLCDWGIGRWFFHDDCPMEFPDEPPPGDCGQ